MSSTPGPHTGILREENLVLRQIFGYGDRPIHVDPLPRTGLPLPGSSIKDILIMSVDVDTGGGYEVISPYQSFHVGISIFDTRYLASNSSTDPQQAIASYQFINRDSKPQTSSEALFVRDYILVAHGINEDLKFLNNIDAGIAARACYILDTVKAAQYTLQLHYRYSLEKLLDALSIPYDYFRLHAAGIDAFFALKGLLMIAARDMSAKSHAWALGNQLTIDTQSSAATILEAIARAPYSLPADKPQETPAPEQPSKLSIGAKRKLRAEKKAMRRANQTLASTRGPEQDPSHAPDDTSSNDHVT